MLTVLRALTVRRVRRALPVQQGLLVRWGLPVLTVLRALTVRLVQPVLRALLDQLALLVQRVLSA